MNLPDPPVIDNGVVFALATGEYERQINDSAGGQFSAALKIQRSTRAVLYALDAATGAELYSSGDQLSSFVHFGGLAVAGGQIYFGDYDNTLYAFGLPIEH
jgi:outer membrane protein assembly factor BamB